MFVLVLNIQLKLVEMKNNSCSYINGLINAFTSLVSVSLNVFRKTDVFFYVVVLNNYYIFYYSVCSIKRSNRLSLINDFIDSDIKTFEYF